jgi:large subunit ribosomal protein L15
MKLNELKPLEGARREKKRIGRGEGSGHGGTSTKGHKGYKARSGGKRSPGFEGGQMPLQRRLPKRGFKNPFRKQWSVINLRDLSAFPDGALVDVEGLKSKGLIKKIESGVKILGEGEVLRPLTVRAQAFSLSAKKKIEAAGGKAEVI